MTNKKNDGNQECQRKPCILNRAIGESQRKQLQELKLNGDLLKYGYNPDDLGRRGWKLAMKCQGDSYDKEISTAVAEDTLERNKGYSRFNKKEIMYDQTKHEGKIPHVTITDPLKAWSPHDCNKVIWGLSKELEDERQKAKGLVKLVETMDNEFGGVIFISGTGHTTIRESLKIPEVLAEYNGEK